MFGQLRFGLVAVMLLAGLFPHLAIAQDVGAAPAGGGNVESAGDGGDGGGKGLDLRNFNLPGGVQEGDAIIDPPPDTNATVEIGADNTTGVDCLFCEGKEGSECQKSPSIMEKEKCTSGFCFVEIHESSHKSQIIRRACAHEGHIKCLEDKPDMCKIFNDIPEVDAGRFGALSYCFAHEKKKANDTTGPIFSMSGRGNKEHRAAYCICNATALCNDRTTVSGAEVDRDRDPGYICTVMGAAVLLLASKATSIHFSSF